MRFVDVKTTSQLHRQARDKLEPDSVDHDYSEVLPSATLNLHLKDEMLLRFGAACSRKWLPYTGSAGKPEILLLPHRRHFESRARAPLST